MYILIIKLTKHGHWPWSSLGVAKILEISLKAEKSNRTREKVVEDVQKKVHTDNKAHQACCFGFET